MKKTIITIVVLAVLIGGVAYFMKKPATTPAPTGTENTSTIPTTPVATTTPTKPAENPGMSVIGSSVEKRDITAYHFGTGEKEVVFIGGIHGGYEWNTSMLAFQAVDYFKDNPSAVPAGVKVTIIPVMNPDGLNKVVGSPDRFEKADVPKASADTIPGRFNGNTVDLNRNFDCDWKAAAVWQSKPVSGGTAAFSEPESLAIKNYVEGKKPAAIVTWYSAAGGVFSSNCRNGVSPETNTLTKTYATASGYPANQSFDFYAITGDMVNWFAKKNIPAISVLLTNHSDTEWTKNKAGIEAVLKAYAQ